MRYLLSLLLVLSCTLTAGGQSFSGRPVVELLEDGRSMRLHQAFSFTDSKGVVWTVPGETSNLNGSSLPKQYWSMLTGPLSGKHRDASILHDHYCTTMSRSWKDTHRMYYEASIARGMDKTQAFLFYAAVYLFGPRWEWMNGKLVVTQEVADHDYVPLPRKGTVITSKGPRTALSNQTEVYSEASAWIRGLRYSNLSFAEVQHHLEMLEKQR